MRILYLGESGCGSTSFHRANALKRLGHDVTVFDPYQYVNSKLFKKLSILFHYRTGYRFLQRDMCTWIKYVLEKKSDYDLIWVNNCELFGFKVVTELKKIGVPVVLYINDDPTGGRDGRRFDSLIKAIPLYSVCAVVRELNIDEFHDLGAPKTIRVWMSYDEVIHSPYEDPENIPNEFRSDVVFVGTWMRHEGRDKFLLNLIKRGVPISIWGDRWHKSLLWHDLKPFIRGEALSGRDYVAALQGAKVCLGMLSKGNRDLHTRRSVEIPYVGGVLCAERTAEHQILYNEGEEALFWSSEEECAAQCLRLLNDTDFRESLRLAGRKRVIANRLGNEDICRLILDKVVTN